MDMFACFNKINAIGKYLVLAILVLNIVPAVHASIQSGLMSLCTMSQMLLGVVVMVLIVLAGVIYAAGQVLGAETRARAAVWATAMLTGAVIGAVIYLVTPIIIRAMLPSSMVGTGSDPCTIASGAST